MRAVPTKSPFRDALSRMRSMRRLLLAAFATSIATPALASVVIPVPIVPEPGALALFAAGAAVVAVGLRLRSR